MMGRRQNGEVQFLYAFDLDKVVPPDHLVRPIDGVLDLSWVQKELAPYYSHTGRPSIDPVLMIRMLLVGYVFALRSERRLCRNRIRGGHYGHQRSCEPHPKGRTWLQRPMLLTRRRLLPIRSRPHMAHVGGNGILQPNSESAL